MLIQGKATKDDISGPIGVAQVIGEVKEQAEPYGIWVVILNMINIALLLSVNLGVMNLLPLPALDGGRLVFLIIEAIRGKPVPPEKEGMVHFAGFVVLMILMVFVCLMIFPGFSGKRNISGEDSLSMVHRQGVLIILVWFLRK